MSRKPYSQIRKLLRALRVERVVFSLRVSDLRKGT